MSEKRRLPVYQVVDGFRIPASFLPEAYRSALKYEPKADDLFIVTFPKCGTTWTQQIVSLIFNKGKSFANYVELSARTPFMEMVGSEGVEGMIRPGSIKVHLPYHLTPISPDAKYLYVVRNPKDTLVSFYQHTMMGTYRFEDGEFGDFFEIFMKGENDFGDYFDHVLGWYEHRNDPNVMFLTYEELKHDTRKSVMKIAKFMGDEYSKMLEEDDEILNNVLKYSSIEHMKSVFDDSIFSFVENAGKSDGGVEKLPAGIKHLMKYLAENKPDGGKKCHRIGKGIVGGWRNNFTADQAKRIDDKIEEKMKGTELYDYWKSSNCI